jgi:hypothetical protein
MEGLRAGTHILKSRGCGVSADTKQRDRGQALTHWRVKDVVCQQAQNKGTEGKHSQPGEQRMWCVSRCKTEGSRANTHFLDSKGCSVSAGAKWRDQGQALTNWRAEDVVCQQVQNGDQGQALTAWRAEDGVCWQVQNRGTEGRHSRPGEQRMQCVSRRKTEGLRAGTHKLESRGRGVSAGTSWRDRGQALTCWRAEGAVY